jgi:quercetin dioxygenase-like cupin family protein
VNETGVGAVTFGTQGYVLARGEGEGLWFLNGLMTVKAGGSDTKDAFTLIEAECPAGLGPPPHIHHDEEEGFYLLEGEVSITCGEHTWTAVPGFFAMLPRGIPHSFRVSDAGNARMLQITSPAQFERFAAEMGEPAQTMTIPPPIDVDVDKLKRLATTYGIEMLPPPAT